MLKTFILSFKLRTTYVMNNIIYSFKQIPLIGKEISDDCYSSKALKVIAIIFAILKEIFWNMFTKKLLYFTIMFAAIPGILLENFAEYIEVEDYSVIIPYLVLTLIGGVIHNEMFSTNQDKYYAIFTMRLDTKKYVITNYIYYLLKNIIAYIPFLFLFGFTEGNISGRVVLTLPIIMVCTKLICSYLKIQYFNKTKKIKVGKVMKAVRIFSYDIFSCFFLFFSYT